MATHQFAILEDRTTTCSNQDIRKADVTICDEGAEVEYIEETAWLTTVAKPQSSDG